MNATSSSDFKNHFQNEIMDVMMNGGRAVLELIIRQEFEDLEKLDPSFGELAQQTKHVLLKIHDLIESDETVFRRVLAKLAEYVEILEQIADSVCRRDNKLLIDCIAHLNEFIEINGGYHEE